MVKVCEIVTYSGRFVGVLTNMLLGKLLPKPRTQGSFSETVTVKSPLSVGVPDNLNTSVTL